LISTRGKIAEKRDRGATVPEVNRSNSLAALRTAVGSSRVAHAIQASHSKSKRLRPKRIRDHRRAVEIMGANKEVRQTPEISA
jgi:hypothetical protein